MSREALQALEALYNRAIRDIPDPEDVPEIQDARRVLEIELGILDSTCSGGSSSESPFDLFWQAYPRKVGKHSARLKFNRLSKTEQRILLDHIGKRVWPKDKQYIPHATTFLNQRRWEDEEQPTTVEPQGDVF